ncbi:MAG: glycosyl hydrolase 115 family protein [Clostridiales bacterium]|nr:glycosyl hydrolase 115 family protein [Clostridiales bacterium]
MPPAITRKTKITGIPDSSAVHSAARHLLRDIRSVCLPSPAEGSAIALYGDGALAAETFSLRSGGDTLELRARDELGFVYGLYEISRRILGVHDLWFWNDQAFTPRESHPVGQDFTFQSQPFAVRLRGWFLNDEVLLQAWHPDGSEALPWEMAFEALLRLGGNMVIPGTGANAHRYRRLASDMGLYITHHHAEPLGAPMFAERYPALTASYAEHPGLFEKLWQEGIDGQKNDKVVWNLGFRRQGDRPFWEDDPRYTAPEARGKLIGELIEKQHRMVLSARPDAQCCTNLYGEVLELYRQGYIEIPDGVIRIWADNGYGKMVSRRQGNHNPRLRSLPEKDGGRHGLYYHVSFYDLQAANHITMLGNPPDFVKGELSHALALGADEYWIVNCSNIKPHVYYLDFAAQLWKTGVVDCKAQQAAYAARYYGVKYADAVSACFDSFFRHAVRYGPHGDDAAGDQYYNYAARILASAYMRGGDVAEALRWASDADTLRGQAERILAVCEQASGGYAEHMALCEQTRQKMHGPARELFSNSLLQQADILRGCALGAKLACQSLLAAMDGDYKQAFFLAGKSQRAYRWANAEMRRCERGKMERVFWKRLPDRYRAQRVGDAFPDGIPSQPGRRPAFLRLAARVFIHAGGGARAADYKHGENLGRRPAVFADGWEL